MSHKTEYIWTCKIGGPAIQFQSGADAPMRQAVQAAFKQVTGNDEVFCFSGWGGELTEPERAVVENRLPSDEHEAEWNRRAAVQAAQPEAVGKPLAEMVNRFLRWKLPADFSPDCGISFKPESDYDHPEFGRTKYEPTGTNLLNYEQAQEMLCYVLAAAPTEAKPATQQASGERDKERDAWLGGSSYEAAMLRELLANIHRDGGHYVARHGLEKALSDAHAVISELRCAALSTPAQQDAVDAALAYLDDLKDDAAAHIWPDDLERCQTSECVVQVASVRMGSPNGVTVPLFTIDQVAEAIDAARASKGEKS